MTERDLHSRPDEHLVRYYLEDVDVWGVRTLHGPITVGSGGRRTADSATGR